MFESLVLLQVPVFTYSLYLCVCASGVSNLVIARSAVGSSVRMRPVQCDLSFYLLNCGSRVLESRPSLFAWRAESSHRMSARRNNCLSIADDISSPGFRTQTSFLRLT